MERLTVDSPIGAVSGVGPTREKQLSRLGINTVRDLIYNFPRFYEERGNVSQIADAPLDTSVSFLLTVASEVKSAQTKNRLTISKFRAFDDTGIVEIVFFNSAFVKDVFHTGSTFRFYGKLSLSKRTLQITSPKYEPYVEGIEGLSAYNYFVVTFERYDKDGNELPGYDVESGEMNKFYVRGNDNVDRYNMRLSYGRLPLGYLEGAYDRLFGIITEKGSSKGVFGSISTEYAPMAFSRIPTNKAQETYTLLSEGNYVTGLDRTEEVHTYVLLNFTGAVDATYYVYSDDYVAEQSWSSQGDDVYRPLGHLDGIYDKCLELYEDALDTLTEEERAAGVKLNCLQVKMKQTMSRIFYLSDFEDIGGIYLKHLDFSDGDYALVYFESCTPEELKEKIASIESLTIVDDVNEVFIIETYETAVVE